MKPLTHYRKNGYDFIVVRRFGSFAMASGAKDGSNDRNYEVFRVLSHDGREISGKHFPPAEFPPSNEQWGTHGWTVKTESEAISLLYAKAKEDGE